MASKTLSQQGLRTASANNVIATQGQVNMSATATQPIQVVNALQRPPRGLVAASAAKQQTSSHARGLITTQRHALKNSGKNIILFIPSFLPYFDFDFDTLYLHHNLFFIFFSFPSFSPSLIPLCFSNFKSPKRK